MLVSAGADEKADCGVVFKELTMTQEFNGVILSVMSNKKSSSNHLKL